MPMPLQKLLQRAGVGTKRDVRALIARGDVVLNGEVTRRFAEPASLTDHIVIAGTALAAPAAPAWYLMHKPKKHLTLLGEDREGRDTLGRYLPADAPLVFPVGRLDFNTEGALLFTNDGLLARAVLHPSSELPKRYRVKLRGHLEPTDPGLEAMRAGMTVDGITFKPASVKIDVYRTRSTWVELILTEGKFREIRKMCHANRYQIVKLRREAIGPIELGDLNPRVVRPLTRDEVRALYAAVGLEVPETLVGAERRDEGAERRDEGAER